MSKFKDTHNDSNIKHHDVPNLYCCKTDDEDKIERYIDTETIAYLAIALTKKGMPDICAFLNEQYGDLMFVPKDLRSYLNGKKWLVVLLFLHLCFNFPFSL